MDSPVIGIRSRRHNLEVTELSEIMLLNALRVRANDMDDRALEEDIVLAASLERSSVNLFP